MKRTRRRIEAPTKKWSMNEKWFGARITGPARRDLLGGDAARRGSSVQANSEVEDAHDVVDPVGLAGARRARGSGRSARAAAGRGRPARGWTPAARSWRPGLRGVELIRTSARFAGRRPRRTDGERDRPGPQSGLRGCPDPGRRSPRAPAGRLGCGPCARVKALRPCDRPASVFVAGGDGKRSPVLPSIASGSLATSRGPRPIDRRSESALRATDRRSNACVHRVSDRRPRRHREREAEEATAAGRDRSAHHRHRVEDRGRGRRRGRARATPSSSSSR